MTTYQNKCLKCSEPYTDTDPEPYYCEKCKEEKKKIAQAVDSKLANRPKRPIKSELAMFDEIAQSRGGRGNNFVRASDLGINLQ